MEQKFIKSFLITLIVVPILVGMSQVFSKDGTEKISEDKADYSSIPISIKNQNKEEIHFLAEVTDEPISTPYTISESKDQLIYFDFYVQKLEDDEEIADQSFDKEALFIETDSIYIQAKNTKITQINHKTGKVSGEATLYVTRHARTELEEFSLSLHSSKDNVITKSTGIIAVNMVVDDSKWEKSSTDYQQSSEVKKATPPSETKESMEEFHVTEENIDDWDHILDDYELEDYYFEHGLE